MLEFDTKNENLEIIVDGLYQAHLAYGNDLAYIIMINEDREVNLWD